MKKIILAATLMVVATPFQAYALCYYSYSSCRADSYNFDECMDNVDARIQQCENQERDNEDINRKLDELRSQ
jgi:hypothetical protein